MDRLKIYEALRTVPADAQRTITGGRLNGKTDINPMWRLKALTAQFGVCGFGWKYVVTRKWLEEGANGEVAAFVDIDLFIKQDGEWSDAIHGTGGNMFVAKERNGLYTSDECYKMALTDAIGVACKSLGMAADIYWGSDATKYMKRTPDEWVAGAQKARMTKGDVPITAKQYEMLTLACATPEGQPDMKRIARLNELTKELGYAKNRDILQKDFEYVMSEVTK